MKNLLTFIFLLGGSFQLFSQNITYAEYFIDNDPGVGNGTQIPVLSQSDSVVLSYTVATPGLSEGMHTLFVRTRDDSARWSHYEGRTFYVTDITPAANKQVVAAEYFFDSDPGAGNSTPLTVSLPSPTVAQNINLPVSGLSQGMHMACFRTKDNQNKWSHFEQGTFYISDETPAAAKQIVAAEYFIDIDLGVGNGSPLSFTTPSDSAQLSFTLNPVFTLGSSHHLFVRTKDSQGKWSHYEGRQFEICSDYGAHSDFRFDINNNSVLFNNVSQHDTTHHWIFGDGNSSTSLYNPSHVFSTSGIYQTCLITTNVCATDTLCRPVVISGVTGINPSAYANTGLAVTMVSGFGFTPNSSVSLSTAGQNPIVADTTIFIDSVRLKAIFAFNSAPVSLWDVVVTTSGQSDTLKNGFTTQLPSGGGLSDIIIDVLGPDQILIGRHTSMRVRIINTGNTAFYGIPVFIFTNGNGGNHSMRLLAPLDNSGANQDMLDSVPPFVPGTNPSTGGPGGTGGSGNGNGSGNGSGPTDFDTGGGGTAQGYTGGFVMPFIPPGGSKSIPFTIQPTDFNCIDLKATAGQPLVSEDEWSGGGTCKFLPACLNCALAAGGFVPGVGCITGAFNLGCSIGNIVNSATGVDNSSASELVWDLIGNIGGTVIDCGGGEAVKGGLAVAAEATDFFGDAYGASGPCSACLHPSPPGKEKRICVVAPGDPNGKYGASGYDPNNFISGDEPLNYTIFFENVDTATAPANEVLLSDLIDTTVFDINSIEFTGFGFGDSLYFISEQSGSFSRDVDLRPDKNIILRISGLVNTNDGRLEARFASFDPLTMNLTDSIFDGFLPPNVSPPQGQGHFAFSISPKANLPHGTVIENAAEIIFDFNAPIVTSAWVNTVDRVKPESAIYSLPAVTSDSVINLAWSGSDDDAGIMDYAIYGSVDNSAYLRLFASDDTLYTFKVDSGHLYNFYSIARDRVLNVEDAPATPDAIISTIIIPSLIAEYSLITEFKISPNPFSNSTNVQFTLVKEMGVTIELTDTKGKPVKEFSFQKLHSGYHSIEINAGEINSGFYLLQLIADGRKVEKVVIIK